MFALSEAEGGGTNQRKTEANQIIELQ